MNLSWDDLPSFISKYSNKKIIFTECECQNSLDGNVCNVSTGQCGQCKPGFFGDFCQSQCKCGNSKNETVCDVSTGKCDLCKSGFGGHFCTGK